MIERNLMTFVILGIALGAGWAILKVGLRPRCPACGSSRWTVKARTVATSGSGDEMCRQARACEECGHTWEVWA